MRDLPLEITDEICSYLSLNEYLKKVLLLSRHFRYSAERHSTFFDKYTFHESNAQEFISRFSGHHLVYLREVEFRPTFSPFQEFDGAGKEMPCRETADQVRERDESFTRQIQSLFRALSLIENRAREKQVQGRYRLSIHSSARKIENKWICPHHLVIGWRVLLANTELPQISSVQSFQIYNNNDNGQRDDYFHECQDGFIVPEFKLDLRILVDLATRFPNLEYLGTKTGGFEWCEYWEKEDDNPTKGYESDWPGLQRDARNDFAAAVLYSHGQLPRTLRKAHLDFLSPLSRTFAIHHGKPLPDLVAPLKHDPFSSSLRLLCQNLSHLQLRCMMDENIFLQEDGAVSIWPNLERLDVMFHVACPNGTWYFHGPDGRGRDTVGFPVTDAHYPPYETTEFDKKMDETCKKHHYRVDYYRNMRFRIVPQDKLRKLLESFAKAAIRMERLKQAKIWCPLIMDDDGTYLSDVGIHAHDGTPSICDPDWQGPWGIRYTAPTAHGSSRELKWWTLPWRPDPELHNLYQQIGRSRFGDDLEEFWNDFAYDADAWSEIDDFEQGIFD